MKKRKPSFFERLTGGVPVDDDLDLHDDYEPETPAKRGTPGRVESPHAITHAPIESELSVDVFQTETEVIVKAMVPGIDPEELDVTITRDMVQIRGERFDESEADDGSFYHRELYWGTFSRSIALPAEVEPEEAQAYEKHGMMEIHLPKINRDKQTKLRVKTKDK
jgi:HSP20 family molecular chaperone IbpA